MIASNNRNNVEEGINNNTRDVEQASSEVISHNAYSSTLPIIPMSFLPAQPLRRLQAIRRDYNSKKIERDWQVVLKHYK